MRMEPGRSRSRGIVYALSSALLFGISTPFIRPTLERTDSAAGAGYLYLGQAILLSVLWMAQRSRRSRVEAVLDRGDALPLVAGIVTGGLIAPGAFTAGLARVSAHQVSLLLGLESVITLLIAVIARRERLSERAWVGAALLLGAGLVVSLPATLQGSVASAAGSSIIGTAFIVLACTGWAVDSNLTAGIAGKDPTVITLIKGWVSAAGYLTACLLMGRSIVTRPADLAVLLIAGGVGYGLSLRSFVLALRHLGAALTTTLFSTAPLAGFAASVLLLGEQPHLSGWIAFAMACLGVAVVSTGVHEHVHTHEDITHDHRHAHDEDHAHDHGPEETAIDGHAHPHHHGGLTHSHPHDSDTHHTHEH